MENKSLMQMQMNEMKELHGDVAEVVEKKDQSGMEKDREIAELYADLYEYKLDLKCFEDELHLIKKTDVRNILNVLNEFNLDSRDYNQDLMGVLEFFVKQKIDESSSYDIISIEDLQEKDYNKAIEVVVSKSEKAEDEIKEIFIKRWDMLIEMKKEHIKDETSAIKVTGLKPYYAERIYKRYHGLGN